MPILGLPVEGDGLQQFGISNPCGLRVGKAIGDPWISPGLGPAGQRGALCRDIQKGLAEVRKKAAHGFAYVVGDNRSHRLEPSFCQGSLDGVPAARADPEKSDLCLVDIRQRRQMIDCAMNVLDTNGRILKIAGIATALSLV